MSISSKTGAFVWTLSAQSSEVASIGDVPILKTPFRVGRYSGLELSIKEQFISGVHATISDQNGELMIEDLGSRNGTFVNGDRIESPTRIDPGDLIQFSECVFRVSRLEIVEETSFAATINTPAINNAQMIIEFEDLMKRKRITPYFQSIVDMETGNVMGFESLARGIPKNLHSPYQLFRAAEKMRRECELSDMLRYVASREYQKHYLDLGATDHKLFLNTHPSEINDPHALIESLTSVRTRYPELELVLEIHESSVTDIDEMHQLGKEVKELGYEIAYDDFGAGQARFFVLIEDPPSYLKFDIRLVKDLHKASARRIQAIEQLVNMVKNLGITCIAEGIEIEDDAKVCRQLGFTLAQGYLYSRPQPITSLIQQNHES